MATAIKVIGVGPGDPNYLTLIGQEAIAEAEFLVGAQRLLEVFALPHQETYPLGANLQEAVAVIKKEAATKKVAVLVSGDTGLYSFAATLKRLLPEYRFEFVPGISSVQLLFAKLQLPWQDVAILSCHGRMDYRLVSLVQSGMPVAVLTDEYNSPQFLAQELLESGCGDLPVTVGCNLSYEQEIIYRGTLASLLLVQEKYGNCVVVVGV
ncbi:precorrin-6y C5,15-methyltransferase (decarboxylating) subunit CbiE [Desulforamulus ferrireducens]|uniref:Precorrin-6y C5,15-methyltransferase (Decarboxylating) subunit CbiE n=1 Tax=Desulforamulus ferrireducens TaxID=1833852 RepID=A0A1S6IZ80_9FIRM|nr:precorrin-6y C5,15-methyltransferase (decarboxylating) subunit CbiE [Desulforamulus ferrireducens]AQS60078.1 precorrin-6y C5,15-methyltransferase (decarboxylating) subunit CbiE [Desulforamulus ferrireducens]